MAGMSGTCACCKRYNFHLYLSDTLDHLCAYCHEYVRKITRPQQHSHC